VSYMAVYPPEELDRALADADRTLRAAAAGRSERRTIRELVASLTELIESDRLDRLDEVIADDAVFEDRRSVVSSGVRSGPGAVRDIVVSGRDAGLRHGDDREVAGRGDDHLLRATTLVGRNDERIERLVLLSRGVADRIVRRVEFDRENLVAAHDELDRVWLESLSGRDAEVARLAIEFDEAAVAGDAEQLAGLLTDDFEHVDHRPKGAGRTGPSEYIALVAARSGRLGDSTALARSRHVVGDCAVFDDEIHSHSTDHGVDSTVAAIGLTHWSGELCARCETFAPEQLGAALARAEEIASSGQ